MGWPRAGWGWLEFSAWPMDILRAENFSYLQRGLGQNFECWSGVLWVKIGLISNGFNLVKFG